MRARRLLVECGHCFQCHGGVVDDFDTDVNVARIALIAQTVGWAHDVLPMDVPVDVGLRPSETPRMNGIVGHEIAIEHVLTLDLLEELKIPLGLPVIVVAHHEALMAIQSS